MSNASSIFDLLGQVDNLSEPVPTLNQRPVAFGLLISFLAVSYICAISRLYVRFRVTKCPGWDDLLVFLSMIASLALTLSVLLCFDRGLGKHFITFVSDQSRLVDFTKNSYVMHACYPTATALIKLAILFQYLRLFDETKSILRQTTFVMIGIVSLWGLAFSFISWFPAFPVSAGWDFNDTSGVRYGFGSLDPSSVVAASLAQTSTNMVLDLIVLAIPVSYYLQPKLNWKSQASLMVLFSLGSVVNVLSLFRLISIVDTRAGIFPTYDPSWYGCGAIVLAALEVSLATVCASLPVFWPVMKFNWGAIFVTYEVSVTREENYLALDEAQAPRDRIDPWNAHLKGPYVHDIEMGDMAHRKDVDWSEGSSVADSGLQKVKH
ncbi:hypothetical protein INS49_009699 [Diaporthe citri]|uniref:uncharacterized protein n=1 Tax=Diaporthe citri TaxID=83186 RepID=UPI001C7E9738|nr:uncharacterized protein INS49_009699 [Diaporthe citri]KAG6361472.1 hypothetical protein INS49_009699 [Diaporthe citri]